MLEAFFRKRRAANEAAELKAIQARDNDAGVPTPETLKKRLETAALEGKWSIVDDCVQKGCSYNDEVLVNSKRRADGYFKPYKKMTREFFGSYYDTYDQLPLTSIAVMHRDVEGLEQLLSKGAPPDWQNYGMIESKRYSPLRLAVRYNLPAAAKLLCDYGADLTDNKPLQEAEAATRLEIVKIIRAEETRRNGAAPAALANPGQAAREKVLRDLNALSREDRGKVLWKLCEEFGTVVEKSPAETQGDMQVLKPITLKAGAKTAP
jgi:hypothetical protein